jgi:hypothetical protein
VISFSICVEAYLTIFCIAPCLCRLGPDDHGCLPVVERQAKLLEILGRQVRREESAEPQAPAPSYHPTTLPVSRPTP